MGELYEQTPDEQLEDMNPTCDTHGELALEDIGVTFGGQLCCTFCSLNQEMDVRNEFDIDPKIDLR
jgi:hypothetical protein